MNLIVILLSQILVNVNFKFASFKADMNHYCKDITAINMELVHMKRCETIR